VRICVAVRFPSLVYNFEGGEPAAQIGDVFLDRSGEIYRRIT